MNSLASIIYAVIIIKNLVTKLNETGVLVMFVSKIPWSVSRISMMMSRISGSMSKCLKAMSKILDAMSRNLMRVSKISINISFQMILRTCSWSFLTNFFSDINNYQLVKRSLFKSNQRIILLSLRHAKTTQKSISKWFDKRTIWAHPQRLGKL